MTERTTETVNHSTVTPMNWSLTWAREIVINPAWDKRPLKWGQHGVDMSFLLHGPKGIVEFQLYPGWYLHDKDPVSPLPVNVFYHSHSAIRPDDDYHEACEHLRGKPCYSGSCCCSTEMFRALIERGGDGLWRDLEALYHKLFDEEPQWLVEPYEQMAQAIRQQQIAQNTNE